MISPTEAAMQALKAWGIEPVEVAPGTRRLVHKETGQYVRVVWEPVPNSTPEDLHPLGNDAEQVMSLLLLTEVFKAVTTRTDPEPQS